MFNKNLLLGKILSLRRSVIKRELTREEKDSIDLWINELIKTNGLDSAFQLVPEKLLHRWNKLFGKEAKTILRYSFKPLPKVICINTLKINTKDFLKISKKYKWSYKKISGFVNVILVSSKNTVNLFDLPEYSEGLFYPQQLSSMLSAIALKPKPYDLILEIGAAPGSKTTQIAEILKNKISIVANDIDGERIKILKGAVKRLGIKGIKLILCDGRLLGNKYNGEFDKVLVDAPCSSEGIIRYKAHKIVEWEPDLIKNLVETQKGLIESGYKSLKPGGVLVYSTCTYNPEENEGVLTYLLSKYHNADIIPVNFKHIKARSGMSKWENNNYDKRTTKAVRIYPNDIDSTGFFICKIVKKKL